MRDIFPKSYDVIIVGAGHAGCEAALASARMGRKTLLLTQNLDTIAAMSCNPSIGGVAKGQLVRELDALGGEMGKNTDSSALQMLTLNRSKGPAMRSPRAQCDKKLYQLSMKETVESTPGLDVLQDESAALWTEGSRLAGVIGRRGTRYPARCVVITTGTFLNGQAHLGLQNFAAGRFGDPPSLGVSKSLAELGFTIGRMKTGTPMRINARSINWNLCERQDGDNPPIPFSHFTAKIKNPMMPCFIAYTTQDAHAVIRENLDRSPLYSGKIKSIGPRYCPSIEDKVVKFPHKERHQLFLEPEGFNTREIYVNGLSTSLPEDVQRGILRAIPALEKAEIMRYGYAIEYDFCPPTQLKASLETKAVENLFFAGQINGSTGYEEAAAQGFIAGVNAALKVGEKDSLVLGRDQAYIGVLIDDLVTKGVDEPYRMFTSRAEFRLTLRSDNADLRLLETGFNLGLIPQEIFRNFERYREAVQSGREFSHAELAPWSMEKARAESAIEKSYACYLRRENLSIQRLKDSDGVEIPEDFDFSIIASLGLEARQKFSRIRPRTLGQASRIPGITPCDVQLVSVFCERARRQPAYPNAVG